MKPNLVALLIAGTACHPVGFSERIDVEPKGVEDSLAQASSKSLRGSHLYFNETFDDASEVAEAWRYECMRELEHSEDDLDTLIDNVNSLSPKENRKCGTGEDVSPLEAMLECCSPSSGVLDPESTEYEPGSGADNLNYSEDECNGFYRQGYCPTTSSGTQRFVTWPTDTRTWPNITKDIKNRKGGRDGHQGQTIPVLSCSIRR